VGIARFSGRSKELRFESTVCLEHLPLDAADLEIEDAARTFPVDYCADEMPDLAQLPWNQTELVHQVRYPTRDAARHDLFAYIEGYYNRQWLHSALGYITPEQAERQAA
jgi:transposase InsO family protein